MKKVPDGVDTNLVSSLEVVKAGVSTLHQQDRSLRARAAAEEQAIGSIPGMPPPVEEIDDNIDRLGDAAHAAALAEVHHTVVFECGGGLELQTDGTYRERRPRLPTLRPNLTAPELFTWMWAFYPDQMKAGHKKAVRVRAVDSPGRLRDRLERVAQHQRKLQEIQEQHTALVDFAAALDPPIVLEILPAVRDRRLREQRKQEAEAAAVDSVRNHIVRVGGHRLQEHGGVAMAVFHEAKTWEDLGVGLRMLNMNRNVLSALGVTDAVLNELGM